MKARLEHTTTSGTFSLDGGSWQVENNVWVVGDDSECVRDRRPARGRADPGHRRRPDGPGDPVHARPRRPRHGRRAAAARPPARRSGCTRTTRCCGGRATRTSTTSRWPTASGRRWPASNCRCCTRRGTRPARSASTRRRWRWCSPATPCSRAARAPPGGLLRLRHHHRLDPRPAAGPAAETVVHTGHGDSTTHRRRGTAPAGMDRPRPLTGADSRLRWDAGAGRPNRHRAGGDVMRRNVIVIGASAGGVEALRTLMAGLPVDLPAAVLVVLHVPSYGGSVLPAILNRSGPLRALHPEHRKALGESVVWVAPPDHHLVIVDHQARSPGAPGRTACGRRRTCCSDRPPGGPAPGRSGWCSPASWTTGPPGCTRSPPKAGPPGARPLRTRSTQACRPVRSST